MSITCHECVLERYPACNAHAPYCHLCPVRLHNIFPHYLIKGMIFDKHLSNIKCSFDYLYQLVSSISYSRKNLTAYDEKCRLIFMQITRFFLSDLHET